MMLAGAAIAALVVTFVVRQNSADASAAPMGGPATQGFTLHIDADHHFGEAHAAEIAHHWCKTINPKLLECQLYDGDGPHARLVGVETIVPVAVWKTFPASEQALWHYHKIELQKVHATLPDTPKDQQAAIIASIVPTYGKVYILWDPMSHDQPMGQPSVTILH
jgi:hypothetical protein